MSDESEDIEPTNPERTTPAPEHIPPAVNPEPDNELRHAIDELRSKVDELSGTVLALVESGGEKDSSPVSKPWTHWRPK